MAAKCNLFAFSLKPKKKTPPELSQTLPLPVPVDGEPLPIEAIFTGYTIDVVNPVDIRLLCLNGGFGQGMLSRAFPVCMTNARDATRKRKRHLPASTQDPSAGMIEEPLCLFLEEAFFLMHVLNILCLKDTRGNTISVAQAFAKFRTVKRNFLACYCAYLYLKSKNWIIKSGIKFGGDFVIYVKGPQFYHASYIVLIQEVFDGAEMQSSAIDGLDFQGFNRIAETTGKDLLFLEVHYPSALDLSDDAACLERVKDVHVAETFTKHHNYLAARNHA